MAVAELTTDIQGSPAGAGIDPSDMLSIAVPDGFPRRRGDRPSMT